MNKEKLMEHIRFTGGHFKDGKFYIQKDKVTNLIEQLDEPEVEKLYKKIKGLESYNESLIRYNNQLLDIVNNQETLSPEWIEENKKDSGVHYIGYYVPIGRLHDILVPNQEEFVSKTDESKPVIPQFVADHIEEVKANGDSLVDAYAILRGVYYYQSRILKWMTKDKKNPELFALAWINGYTVEEEPLYRARLKVITDEFIASYLRTQSSDAEDRLKALEIGSKYIHEDYRHLSEFTEDELKGLGIWDSEQWEVEGVEE